MAEVLISIIVPVYNAKEYLSTCVGTILNQSYKNTEVILIDDGSADGSGELCDEYARANKNVRVIHKENEGAAVARNVGIEAARGEYITFADADDFMRENCLSRLMEIAEEAKCSIVQCGYEFGASRGFTKPFRRGGYAVYPGRKALLDKEMRSTVWGKLYRREAIGNFRLPPGKVNEDEFFIYKVIYNADVVAISKERLYYYFRRLDGVTNRIQTLGQLDSRNDWLDALGERMKYFIDAGDPAMCVRTHERYCAEALLRYVPLRAAGAGKDTLEGLLGIFREHIGPAREWGGMSALKKVLYRAFSVCPGFVAAVMAPLYLRR
jgi:glycosyltransferase involved in cell wall biosynthesis